MPIFTGMIMIVLGILCDALDKWLDARRGFRRFGMAQMFSAWVFIGLLFVLFGIVRAIWITATTYL